MRLCHRAGHAVPLLTLTAILAGCGTSTTAPPANFNSNPQVVAVYAVDSSFGTMPDVLIYSTDPADVGKVSTNPPPSFGSYRVEFDQPINGATVANDADRGVGPTPGGAASFCSPLATNPIQLVDIEGGNRVVVSSVCYDATSPLGSHPHVLVVPGRNALNSTTAAPLTCNTFRADPGFGPGDNVFTPKHKYGIKVNAGTIQNGAGKPLAAPPTTGGWVGDTFQFTTSGFRILAAGFQDANTGFLVWLDKPEPGFEKDLAPCATTSTCPDAAGNNVLSAFEKPADGNPFLVLFSEPVTPDIGPLGSDVSAQVALTRAEDGSNPDSGTLTGSILSTFFDSRVAEVFPGDTFEPGVAYKVTIDPALAANSGDVLENAKTYTFNAAPGTPARLSTAPANGAQAQAHTVQTFQIPVAHTDNGQPVAPAPPPNGVPVTGDLSTVVTRIRPQIEFSSPVAAGAGGAPVGTYTVTGPAGAAAVTPSFRAGFNNQVIRLTPAASLLPETTYTLAWKGVTAAAVPKAFAGQPFPDGSTQFTTATFRMAILNSPTIDTTVSNTNIRNTGVSFPDVTVVAVNIDRRTDIEPADVKNGNLRVIFNNHAAGVDATSVVVNELTGTANTATPVSGVTVVATPADTTQANYTIRLPAGYQQKYGQKYEVRAKPTITNPDTGKALKAEGAAGGDDVKSFTTRKVLATVASDPLPRLNPATTGFTVSFSDPMDPATIDLANQFKLFARDSSGALSTTATPITCKLTDGPGSTGTATNPTVVTCTPNGGLGLTPKAYLASAVFLQTAPVKVLPAVSADPSAVFFGSVSANVFAPCQ